MFYIIWVVGVLLAILASIVVTMRLEKNNDLDE
ncbi:membrane bound YbgT-like protein [Mesocricetibacter intestinalis]|uniref:Membrane bound YbgT-like protein n=1 Tax=Mesocricetibacter intestinalis TaxID=1521930 RepID=A0A4R6VFV6_9PAST|nr:cytochrome bd oxidase small subunit, CydX/CbdX family [Mesocricetibacter intestinalis]TDQ59875.1 membrane bound YbgT-like protein [Mesocricetibacter intestinalis]